ncbi:hypothetical protein GUJ93_ZPchr0004g38895 [Zizania palustris]|uniref:Regulatory protein RecX n=1 Tax=Zizania palustris TaxID=103762 RepID=A0A8J5T3X7_ZIZPA|nr:hypothetical protein GUJ93_ZPchr0004g38895 [Zizania palustris]
MAALAASRRLLQLRPELELCLRSRALIPFPSWTKGAVRFRHATPARMLVSCRQGAYGERNAAKNRQPRRLSSDEPLTHGKDDDGSAVEYMGKHFGDELGQLSLGEEESDDVVCGISESIARDVEKAAVDLLASRAFTVSELRKKLRAKKFPDNAVDSVVANFKSRGLLNDGYYAESFSRSRWLSSTWGPRRIKQALLQKGVPDGVVDEATRRVFQDGDGHSNHATHGISQDSMDRLFAHAAKQWQRGLLLPPDNRRARVVRWLQYRGFSWAVTNAIVRKLEAQHLPED